MAWSYQIKEVSTPSLLQIRTQFVLLNDGLPYVPDEISISPQELDGLTNAQKLTLIRSKIEAKCADYIKVFNVSNGLKTYEGQTINIT